MHKHLFILLALATFSFGFSLLSNAATGLTITQVYDSVEAKKYEAEKKEYSTTVSPLIGKQVPVDTPIIVGRESRFEIKGNDYVMRAGGTSKFTSQLDGSFKFDQGVIIVQPLKPEFTLTILTSKLSFKAHGIGAFIMETTSNGGCKIIALSEKPCIEIPHQSPRELIPGNLIFLVPDKNDFGPTVDIDLYTLYSTSALLHGFNQSLEKIGRIRFGAFFQSNEVDAKSNAIVGDAPDTQNFNIMVVE